MRFHAPGLILRFVRACAAVGTIAAPSALGAQRGVRAAAVQAFDVAECRGNCLIDTVSFEVDRGRRAQTGAMTASLLMIDTLEIARRGAPATPRERPVSVWIACDSTPCGAAIVNGRISDKRLDDARVARRTVAVWPLPASLMLRLLRSTSVAVLADGKSHALSPATVSGTRALIESIRANIRATAYSPRSALYVATFATFGVPGDSTMAEDVGTATEPLMIPDATTSLPTRVATLTIAGRGADAVPLLVQDDGTGAAPLFGIGETVAIALPGKIGRRAVVSGKILARQRVEAMRDACQGTKVWTYLVSLSPADLAIAQRSIVASPRPGEGIDRWNGTAVRESYPPRMVAAEQRVLTASRSVVTQFVRERPTTGVRERDVQVLAALPRAAGLVTNFGVFAKDGGGNWRFPTFTLRPATCP
jgi:hypothetical protein